MSTSTSSINRLKALAFAQETVFALNDPTKKEGILNNLSYKGVPLHYVAFTLAGFSDNYSQYFKDFTFVDKTNREAVTDFFAKFFDKCYDSKQDFEQLRYEASPGGELLYKHHEEVSHPEHEPEREDYLDTLFDQHRGPRHSLQGVNPEALTAMGQGAVSEKAEKMDQERSEKGAATFKSERLAIKEQQAIKEKGAATYKAERLDAKDIQDIKDGAVEIAQDAGQNIDPFVALIDHLANVQSTVSTTIGSEILPGPANTQRAQGHLPDLHRTPDTPFLNPPEYSSYDVPGQEASKSDEYEQPVSMVDSRPQEKPSDDFKQLTTPRFRNRSETTKPVSGEESAVIEPTSHAYEYSVEEAPSEEWEEDTRDIDGPMANESSGGYPSSGQGQGSRLFNTARSALQGRGQGLARNQLASFATRQASLAAARVAAAASVANPVSGTVIAVIAVIIGLIIIFYALPWYEEYKKQLSLTIEEIAIRTSEQTGTVLYCPAPQLSEYFEKYGFYPPDEGTYPWANPLNPGNQAYFNQAQEMAVKYSHYHGLDPVILVWWIFFETGSTPDSYSFSNCGGYDRRVDFRCPETRDGAWQLGYGVQFSRYYQVPEAFNVAYGDLTAENTQRVGQNVLDKAGQSLTFPNMSVTQLKLAYEEQSGQAKEDAKYWLSVLMRDPAISAYIESEVLKGTVDNSSGITLRDRAFGWHSYYRTNWQAASNLLADVIAAWRSPTSSCRDPLQQGPVPTGSPGPISGDICPAASRNIICTSAFDDQTHRCKHCLDGLYPGGSAALQCRYPGTYYAIDVLAGRGETVYLPTIAGKSIKWRFIDGGEGSSGQRILKYSGIHEPTGEQYYLQLHHSEPGSGNPGEHMSGEPGGRVCTLNIPGECDHTHVQIASGAYFPAGGSGSMWLDAAAYMCR